MIAEERCVVLQAGGDAPVGQEVAGVLNGRLVATIYDWRSLEDLCRVSPPHVVVLEDSFTPGAAGEVGSQLRHLSERLTREDGVHGAASPGVLLWTQNEAEGFRDYEHLEAVIGCYVLPDEWNRLRAELGSWWGHRVGTSPATPCPTGERSDLRRDLNTLRREATAQQLGDDGPWERNGRPGAAGRRAAVSSHTVEPHQPRRPQLVPRQLVAVVSPKGGVGKTFVAVNLAVGLAARTPAPTLLIDLDLTSSDTAVHLDLLDTSGLIDLLPHCNELRRRGLDAFVTPEPHSGLHVLCGPDEPELAELVTEVHVGALLRQAVNEYPFVVVDTGADLRDPTVRLVLEEATVALLVTAPEATSLRHTRQLLDRLSGEGVPPRLMTVVNAFHAASPVNLRGMRSFLGHDLTAVVARSTGEVEASIFNGRPLLLHQPDAAASQGLRRLLHALYPVDDEENGSLGGRVRRWSRRLVAQWLGGRESGAAGGFSLGL